MTSRTLFAAIALATLASLAACGGGDVNDDDQAQVAGGATAQDTGGIGGSGVHAAGAGDTGGIGGSGIRTASAGDTGGIGGSGMRAQDTGGIGGSGAMSH